MSFFFGGGGMRIKTCHTQKSPRLAAVVVSDGIKTANCMMLSSSLVARGNGGNAEM